MAEKIETIFDHNVTEEEIEILFGMTGYTEEYLQKKPQDRNYAHIYCLYLIRKDEMTAMKYFNLIPDSINKYFSLGNHDFAI
ncbi:MAG: hypothetical protein IKJ52_05685 [Muribaculaceae bacterium]|nr:hypothetical protein [Muribaculaceae bacterium]